MSWIGDLIEKVLTIKDTKEILAEYSGVGDLKKVRTLLASVKKVSAEDILFRSDEIFFNEEEYATFSSMLSRCDAGEPLSKILNRKEFWKHTFYVDENVLDPRPETELIIESALKFLDPNSSLNFLDIASGSGCVLLSILLEFENSSGVGIDIDEKTIEVAKKNKAILGVKNATFANIAWNDLPQNYERYSFDVVVSNPPYIRSRDILSLDKNVRDYDPLLALDGGDDGLLAYREITPIAADLLKNGGLMIFEVGYDQSSDVASILSRFGFQVIDVAKDMSDIARTVIARKIPTFTKIFS